MNKTPLISLAIVINPCVASRSHWSSMRNSTLKITAAPKNAAKTNEKKNHHQQTICEEMKRWMGDETDGRWVVDTDGWGSHVQRWTSPKSQQQQQQWRGEKKNDWKCVWKCSIFVDRPLLVGRTATEMMSNPRHKMIKCLIETATKLTMLAAWHAPS